ncbi:Cytosolic acyl coenzyme A thioester hydrolase, inducible [Candidatus Paraburkholderia kirkii]|nr:Cytosolic acyl coenzyme A thioester hydrolase, inducible [Candidatus Paraburkholderia kirkii]
MSGQSRGGELALLLGATYPDRIKAVIGYVPGAVVHSAQNAADPAIGREGPTWLLDGKPLPHLWENNRTASWKPFDDGRPPHRHERAIRTALLDEAAVERARIRVEHIAGPVLLLSATDDGSWPSSEYSRMVVERFERQKHAYLVRHLDCERTGHAIVFPYVPTTQLVYTHPVSGRISTGGGEPAANARAEWTQCLRQSNCRPSARTGGIRWNGNERSSSRHLNQEPRSLGSPATITSMPTRYGRGANCTRRACWSKMLRRRPCCLLLSMFSPIGQLTICRIRRSCAGRSSYYERQD